MKFSECTSIIKMLVCLRNYYNFLSDEMMHKRLISSMNSFKANGVEMLRNKAVLTCKKWNVESMRTTLSRNGHDKKHIKS